MHLSVVIPAYNEAGRIRPALEAYAQALQEEDAELLVIVNGSSDRTEHIIRDEFIPRYPFLRMLVIPERVGKGGALMRGMREARGAHIAFTDADGSTPPTALLSLDAQLQEGILIGSRWLPGSRIGRPQPLSRRLASRAFNRLVRLMFSLQVTDTQCGAKVMSREAMEAALPDIGATQWAFDVDLLFHIQRQGYPIREEPTEWNDVSGSKIRIARSSLGMIAALLRLRLICSPFSGLVQCWDRGPGRKLFQRRLEHMRAIYRHLEESE